MVDRGRSAPRQPQSKPNAPARRRSDSRHEQPSHSPQTLRQLSLVFAAPGALEQTQKGTPDITRWLEGFLDCLDRSLERAEVAAAAIIRKASTWDWINHAPATTLNERQRLVINALLDAAEPDFPTSRYAKLAHCSLDAAPRDIKSLVEAGILRSGAAGGRSTSYHLASPSNA